MGVLRQGQAWVETNYQSPQEIAQRKFLECKLAERRLKNLKEELYKFALDEWKDALTDKQRDEIVAVKKGAGDIAPPSIKLSIF